MRRPPHAVSSLRAPFLLLGLMLAFPAPAFGATFQFVGDGTSQSLHWIWSYYYPVTSCFGFPQPPCGAVFAINGEIPYSGYGDASNPNTCILTRGSLDWSAGAGYLTGQLSVVAFNQVRLGRYYAEVGCVDGQDAWSSVDAREVPLQFIPIREPGDPPTLDLAISPRLVGSVFQKTWKGESTVNLQYMTSIRVNGLEVSGDTLVTQMTIPDSSEIEWTPELPDGAANSVTIPGLGWNTDIEIMAWAYMRGVTTGDAMAWSTGPYGQELAGALALVIDVRAANAVGVEAEPSPGKLWLSARPNPATGPMRILYALPEASRVNLATYDITGARVATLADRNEPAGRGSVEWNRRDKHGSRVAPGLYFVELLAGRRRTIAKVALLGP